MEARATDNGIQSYGHSPDNSVTAEVGSRGGQRLPLLTSHPEGKFRQNEQTADDYP